MTAAQKRQKVSFEQFVEDVKRAAGKAALSKKQESELKQFYMDKVRLATNYN